MTSTEERMQILKMIQEGKITADEGARLLEALNASAKAEKRPPAPPIMPGAPSSDSRWFRVRVTDLRSGRSKVNVNIPMGLVNVGLKMGARFAPNKLLIEMADKNETFYGRFTPAKKKEAA